MIKSLSAAAVAVVGLGLLAAAPASATTTSPSGAGYLASPAAFHSARVTVRVPTVSCAKSSPARGVRLGLFVTVVKNGRAHPVSLTVDASCRSGRARYAAGEGSGSAGAMHVHHGDRVLLELSGSGASNSSIEDLTTGEAEGGGSGGSGSQPQADRHVLIGAKIVGRPHPLRVTFENAKVDGHSLGHVTHHRQAGATSISVGPLKHGDFQVRLSR